MKIFVCGVIQNDSKQRSSGFEKGSVIKFLVAEKCKPCKIYERMHDVHAESYFSNEKNKDCIQIG